jgi:hypothetical protein
MSDLDAFTPFVKPDVPGCPDFLIERAVVRAAIKFCESLMFPEDLTVPTVIGERQIELAPTTGAVSQLLRVTGDNGRTLKPTDRTQAMKQARWGESAQPQAAWLEFGSLVFDSLPDAVETLAVTVTTKPAHDATEVPDFLLADYPDETASGAKWFLHQMPGKGWSDPALALYHKGVFLDAIDRARIKQAMGATPSDLRVTPRRFGQ